jgi:integrase
MPRKRSSGDGALYEDKTRGLWKAVVDVGFWPDGRRRQKTVTGRTQRIARDKLDALKRDIADHGAPVDRSMRLGEWADRWLAEVCRPHMKPNGLAAYESVVRTWIVPAIGRRPVADLKPSDVRSVVRGVLDAGRSTATARKAHDILSGMLESARMEQLIARNVAEDVKAPKVIAAERGALSSEEVLRILLEAQKRPEDSRWVVSLLCGIRQGERLGMTLDSLDLDRGLLTIRWSLDEVSSEHGCSPTDAGWSCGRKQGAACPQARLKLPDGLRHRQLAGRLVLVPPKSGRERTFPVPPLVVVALRPWLAIPVQPNPHGLVWPAPDGRPYLPRDDQAAWADLLRRAGVDPTGRTTHWARHTTATALMELGVDAKIIGEIVGHQSEAVTRRYQHVSSSAAREAMEKLGARYELPTLRE